MLKNKNKVKVVNNISDEDEASDFYDSMVENGTSDEDDKEEENKQMSDKSEQSSDQEDQDESDDGFSDKESDIDKEVASKIPSQSVKRKINEPPSKPNTKKMKSEKSDLTQQQSKSLFKAPTVEEINRLRETETQFHSNLFRLQIEEMLKELKPKKKLITAISEWLDKFNSFLNDLKSQDDKMDSDKLTWINEKKFKSSFQRKNAQRQAFQFQFLKPNKPAEFIGSFISDTVIDSKMKVIDVCIEMPAQTFQKGDYLNLIYEEKRSLYMLYLVQKLVQSKKFDSEQINYNYYQNNRLKPLLEINIGGKYENKILFRIFPVPEKDSFKLNRFVPWNSNIRCSLFGDKIPKEEEIHYATPNYNSNVLFDMTMKQNNELIKNVVENQKNLTEGIILLKIWLKQRGLNQGSSGMGNHIISLFVVWLFRQKKINSAMSSYQIARYVWHQLAASSWNEEGKGVTLCTEQSSDPNQPTLEQMHQYFDVVFIDCTGYFNLCANMSLDIYLRIKFESSRAIELLNDNTINSFQQLFMTQLPIYIQFDHIFGFKRSDIRKFLDSENQKPEKLNYAGYWLPHAIKIVTKTLRKGLKNRILSMTSLETPSESWPLNSDPNKINRNLRIGLVLNPEEALQVLDKGPQANEPDANQFQEFWGEKSELRRFQDGSITEACVWALATDTLTKKRLIVSKIVKHLLRLHFRVANVEYLANQFDVAYDINKEFDFDNAKFDAEFYSLDVIKNFEDIGKKLRALQDLPLDVTGIQGISSVFRYAEPIPILNQARDYMKSGKLVFRSRKVNEGIIELGISGKWPNDLAAFKRLKTAFHIQIADSLRKVYKLKTLGGIDGILILNNGYLYKIEVANMKEVGLLKQSTQLKGITHHAETADSIELEKRFNILPRVTSALHGLYQRFSSYGPTVMIAKRWLNSQLIDASHWPDEYTEFIIASQYLKHNTLPNPCQPQTGFLRFLHILANFNWKSDMFILNFNDEISQAEIRELEERFSKERDTFPPIFVATSFDDKRYGLWWSPNSPSKHIVARVTLLAKHALEILAPAFRLENPINLDRLFLPSFEGYDAVIVLKKEYAQNSLGYNFRKDKDRYFNRYISDAGHSPIEFALKELREGYSEFAVFFHDAYGGCEIAVLWKPNIFEPKEFNLSSINACHPSEDEKLQCKADVLIADFKIILKGLYREIILK